MSRLGFVGPLPPIRGGIAQHSANLVAALRELGHTVDVHSWASQYPGLLYGGDHTPVSAGMHHGTSFTLRWWAPWTWIAVGRLLRRCDVVIVPWVHPFHALALWTVLVVAGRPSVGVVHNLTPHERVPGDTALARWVLGRTCGLLVQSSAVAAETARALPAVPIAQVTHPPNLPLSVSPPPTGPARVLFLGFVRHYKGVDVLLDALLDPACADVSVTIAGELWDPGPEQLTAWIEERGLASRVTVLAGYVADETVADLLATHQLLVAPYRSATQSGLVPLAHAAGRPVVATAVGGLADQVEHGVDGLLVPAEDPTELAAGIREAIDHIDELSAGAAAAAPAWRDVAAAVEALCNGSSRSTS